MEEFIGLKAATTLLVDRLTYRLSQIPMNSYIILQKDYN